MKLNGRKREGKLRKAMKRKKREEGPQFRIVLFEHFFLLGRKVGKNKRYILLLVLTREERREERRKKKTRMANTNFRRSTSRLPRVHSQFIIHPLTSPLYFSNFDIPSIFSLELNTNFLFYLNFSTLHNLINFLDNYLVLLLLNFNKFWFILTFGKICSDWS